MAKNIGDKSNFDTRASDFRSTVLFGNVFLFFTHTISMLMSNEVSLKISKKYPQIVQSTTLKMNRPAVSICLIHYHNTIKRKKPGFLVVIITIYLLNE